LKTRPLSPLILAACLPWLACRQPAAAENDEAPYAFRANVAREPIADSGGPAEAGALVPGVNWSAVAPFVARNDAHGALALAALETLVSTFVSSGKTLALAKTPEAIAADIAAAVSTKTCPTSTVSYKAGTAYLTVAFGSKCELGGSGFSASGAVMVGVTASSAGQPWAAVAFSLSNVGMDRYTVDGYATLATDGTKDTLDTRMALAGLGTVAFHGNSTGDGTSAALEGTGTWTGIEAAPTVAPGGWDCVASRQSALTLRAIGKTATDCYANRGTLDIARAYSCLRHGDGASTEMTSLVSAASVSFLPTTAATGSVTVIVGATAGSVGASAPGTALPENACLARTVTK
jgi:hypothetical protein